MQLLHRMRLQNLNNMQFRLIATDRVVHETDSLDAVYVPTTQGEIGILPEHIALVSVVVPGVLRVEHENSTEEFAIGRGVLETDGARVTIIADMIESADDIDLDTIATRKQEAEKLMNEYRSSHETISMEKLIELEETYMKESAREMLAARSRK